MIHLDLFSGIGGFALAVDTVWHDQKIEHIFCDNDPFCQAVIEKHWPNSRIYADIRSLTYTQSRDKQRVAVERKPNKKVDTSDQTYILTGGFPCQPFSQAGRRKGTSDNRFLWPEMLRVIREFRPRWVIGENVAGLLTIEQGLVFKQVLTDLEGEGYEVQPFVIPACSVNAPHRRDRVWIVAHTKYQQARDSESRGYEKGTSARVARSNKDVANSESKGRKRGEPGEPGEPTQSFKGVSGWDDWRKNWLEVAARLCRMDDGLPRRLDRNPRLKALGNAIVPQVAVEIMKGIREIERCGQ